MKMPFGKYRNISLEFVPSGYFNWLLDQDWFLKKPDETLLLAIEKEMHLRDMDGSHFYEDKVRVRYRDNS